MPDYLYLADLDLPEDDLAERYPWIVPLVGLDGRACVSIDDAIGAGLVEDGEE